MRIKDGNTTYIEKKKSKIIKTVLGNGETWDTPYEDIDVQKLSSVSMMTDEGWEETDKLMNGKSTEEITELFSEWFFDVFTEHSDIKIEDFEPCFTIDECQFFLHAEDDKFLKFEKRMDLCDFMISRYVDIIEYD